MLDHKNGEGRCGKKSRHSNKSTNMNQPVCSSRWDVMRWNGLYGIEVGKQIGSVR